MEMINKKFILMALVLFTFILFFPLINAGPYGYGDSMDLKYKIINGKIIYGYGNETKYATSLKPLDVNWSEWKPESKREIVNKSWEEIFNMEEKKESYDVSVINNLVTSLVNKISNFFLGLVGKKEVSTASQKVNLNKK